MRPVECLDASSSLERAAALVRQHSPGVVPIQKGSSFVGVITERTLAEALANGCTPFDPAEAAAKADFPTIGVHESGAEALRRLASGSETSLLVLDEGDRVIGVASASDLYPKQPYMPKPPLVGGMATPFGVYLTNGSIGAGVPRWALAATGAVMFTLFAIGAFLQVALSAWADKSGYISGSNSLWEMLPVAVLFIGMRVLPLSGIHAAEHKVVHAIERGEALVPEVVARMPRVHPRCGTNLWAGATIFISVFSAPFFHAKNADYTAEAMLVAAIVTFVLWRPVGSAMQFLLTTRPPSRKHIEMGIKSGKELLEKYRFSRGIAPNPLQRLWNSGIFHVMGGFAACYFVCWGVGYLFDFNLPF